MDVGWWDMKVQTAICDMPGCGGKGAQTYEVKMPDGGTLRADLCVQHAKVLTGLRDQLPKALFSKAGARRKAVRIQVDPLAAQ